MAQPSQTRRPTTTPDGAEMDPWENDPEEVIVDRPPGFRKITPPSPPSPPPTSETDETEEPARLVDDDVSVAAHRVLSGGSTRRSTNPALVRSIAPLVATALSAIAVGLHLWRSRRRPTSAWLMSETQAHDMAQPLARLLARRVPDGAGELVDSDVGDLIDFGVQATGYAVGAMIAEAQTPAVEEESPEPPVDPRGFGG